MKILVFGASGMIGHKMFLHLQGDGHEVYGTVHHDLASYSDISLFKSEKIIPAVDVAKNDQALSILENLKPDLVINCVGITLRKPEIKDLEYCTKINSEFPHFLKNWVQANKSYLIHFSTDCVFSGEKEFYTEDAKPDATDVYGRTKALGEVIGENVLTLRGSQLGFEIFGKSELLEWALKQKKKTVKGYKNAIYSGVTTVVMAELVASLIVRSDKLTGLYHVSSAAISKYELLQKINQKFQLEMTIYEDEGYHTRKVLLSEKINQRIGFRCPSWDTMIDQLLLDRQKNIQLY